jgi:hypothetical protein
MCYLSTPVPRPKPRLDHLGPRRGHGRPDYISVRRDASKGFDSGSGDIKSLSSNSISTVSGMHPFTPSISSRSPSPSLILFHGSTSSPISLSCALVWSSLPSSFPVPLLLLQSPPWPLLSRIRRLGQGRWYSCRCLCSPRMTARAPILTPGDTPAGTRPVRG